ncbi:protein max-like isoform X2 [Branchiostoma lanceolatum]|uniref:Protein max n=1 Tax=Branchiostoma lanceolatum TaxID=7740 RepID=A0A8J9ZXK2_BRALA|nr:MAX [Branchiostoma lanceolatum]
MSDDERDLDVDSDDDGAGDGAGGERSGMTAADKRAHHNALERQRRDHIKNSFSSLRDAVPALQGEKDTAGQTAAKQKASRAQILNKATDYIQYMRRKNQTHQQDIDDLKKQNALLDQQVRALEKARATGNLSTALLNDASSLGLKTRSGSDSSDSDDNTNTHTQGQRKRLKTDNKKS